MPEPWTEGRPASQSDPSKGPVRPAAEARDRDLRRLQGLQMLMERAAGSSLRELAEKYRIPEDQADEIMTEAWKDGVLDRLQEQLYTQLSPLAMATYEAQLKMGNLDAARDVLGTIGVIERPGIRGSAKKQALPQGFAASQMAGASAPAIPLDSIENYRLARQQRSYRPPQRRITPGSDD